MSGMLSSFLLSLPLLQGDPSQAAEGLRLDSTQYERAAGDPEPRVRGTLSLLPRTCGIFGLLDDNSGARFEDLWRAGAGNALEGGLLFPLRRDWSIGLSLLAGHEAYEGDSFTDDFDQVLEAEDLWLSRCLINFKIMHSPERGPFFDARLGLGFATYSEVDGTFDDGTGEVDVSLLEASTVFCGELAAHAGFSGRWLWIAAGLSVRVQGAPATSDDFIFSDTDDPAVLAFELEFGFKF